MKAQTGRRLAALALALGGVAFLVAAGACFAAATFLPYARIREVLVASSNMAGAAFFTESYYAGAMWRAKWAGVFCLASALGLWGLWIWRLRRAPAETDGKMPAPAETAESGAAGKRWLADRTLWIVLLVSLGLRLPYLFQPGSSDEVRGYYAWTARPFVLAVSDYRAPQHLLYTLLDYPIVRWFGNGEWAIRLPAFAAGILLPVMILMAGRRWFGRPAGLWAAGLLAANPIFVHFSVNGRAYTLHACMIVALWLAAVRLAERPGARGRVVLALAGAVGLVALPTMVYPLAGTYLWLLLVYWGRRREQASAWPKNVGWLVACGAATVWLAALAYLPAYVASDRWYSVDADDVSTPVPGRLLPARLGVFLVGAFRTWNQGLPEPLVVLFLLLGLVGVAALWRKKPFHLLLFNLAAILGVSVLFRIVPYVRTALYFGMAYFMVVGAGAAQALEFSRRGGGGTRTDWPTSGFWAALATLLLAANLFFQNRHGFTEMGMPAPGVRALMADLKPEVNPGDHFVCAKPTSGPLYYYHLRNGMDCRMWFIPEERPPEAILASSQAVYVVVNDYGGQTLESVLRATGWSESVLRAQHFGLVRSNRFATAFRRE